MFDEETVGKIEHHKGGEDDEKMTRYKCQNDNDDKDTMIRNQWQCREFPHSDCSFCDAILPTKDEEALLGNNISALTFCGNPIRISSFFKHWIIREDSNDNDDDERLFYLEFELTERTRLWSVDLVFINLYYKSYYQYQKIDLHDVFFYIGKTSAEYKYFLLFWANETFLNWTWIV